MRLQEAATFSAAPIVINAYKGSYVNFTQFTAPVTVDASQHTDTKVTKVAVQTLNSGSFSDELGTPPDQIVEEAKAPPTQERTYNEVHGIIARMDVDGYNPYPNYNPTPHARGFDSMGEMKFALTARDLRSEFRYASKSHS